MSNSPVQISGKGPRDVVCSGSKIDSSRESLSEERTQIKIIRYDSKTKKAPEVPGYENVVIDKYSDFSTDILKDKNGNFLTNVWEFSKLFPRVAEQGKDQVWWTHPEEVHVKDGVIDSKYWAWRTKGMTFKHPIRYVNGQSNRNKFIHLLRACETEFEAKQAKKLITYKGTNYESLNHIEARTKLFFPMYSEAVKKQKVFTDLKVKTDKGTKIAIYDVDGFLETKKNGVKCINKDTVEITKENVVELLGSDHHTFGAGICLAVLLLGKEEWLNGK